MYSTGINKFKPGLYRLVFLLMVYYIPVSLYSQVNADFSADVTTACTQVPVHFTNLGSSGAGFSYKWYFGGFGTSTSENPSFSFPSPGDITVSFVVTNTSTLEKDSIAKIITVVLTPNANLNIDSTNACVHGRVLFTSTFSRIDSTTWNFGDGTSYNSFSSYNSHIYNANGTYPVTYITYYQGCSDTSNYIIHVNGPVANILISPAEACKGAPVEFTMVPISGVSTFSWDLGESDIQFVNPASHSYNTKGDNIIKLTVTGVSGSCVIEDTAHIYQVTASFTPSEARCEQQLLVFNNTSIDNDENYWVFGNGNTSLAEDGSSIYNAGTYTVSLRVENSAGCADSTEQVIVVNVLPEIQLMDEPLICPGVPTILSVSGGDSASWFPPEDFDDPHSYHPSVAPDSTTTYFVTITNTTTHCSNSGQITVNVQPGFIPDKISMMASDDSIIIGETVLVTIFDTLGRDLSFTWTPVDWITCADCDSVFLQPLESTNYTLVISDTNQCFSSESFEIGIAVREEYRIGVPEAFTPNGDQINDFIKVDGWGIKHLIEFRIYNRWGTEVFFTDDVNQGWNGYYKDKLQNIDTYSYVIRAEMWDDNITTKQGTFSLLR